MMSSYDWAHSGITHLFHNIQVLRQEDGVLRHVQPASARLGPDAVGSFRSHGSPAHASAHGCHRLQAKAELEPAALCHLLRVRGSDPSVWCRLQSNGYRFMFLSSRAIAQASTTRDYLQRLNQDGHKLPAGAHVTHAFSFCKCRSTLLPAFAHFADVQGLAALHFRSCNACAGSLRLVRLHTLDTCRISLHNTHRLFAAVDETAAGGPAE